MNSFRSISTSQLNISLHLHTWPINLIVFKGSYMYISTGRSHLKESFTLICFQRLSSPYVATQLWTWQSNWCTRGTSTPVFSY